MNGNGSPAPVSGPEALQELVDVIALEARAQELRFQMTNTLAALDRAIYRLTDRRARALRAIEELATTAPAQLGLRVPDGALQQIAEGDAAVSVLESQVAEIVARVGEPGGAA